ncbi:MAG: hypothetical protein IAG13_27390 [Deltaproteobacteria bacterium]|nr:hypothetical protein [Nannocystaceae bacterium]
MKTATTLLLLASSMLACRGAESGAGLASMTDDDSTAAGDSSDSSVSSGAVDSTGADAEPMLLSCPVPGSLPFTTMATAFETPAAGDVVAMNPRFKDQSTDLLGVPGGAWAGTTQSSDDPLQTGEYAHHGEKARGPADMGLAATPIVGEWVSLWSWDGAAWNALARTQTGADGSYDVAMVTPTFAKEQPIYAVLEGDGSCAPHYNFLLPEQTQVILTDIDGTMTLSDEELFLQIADGSYDPAENMSASAMMNLWADKGYVIVYLTARPHAFRAETRAWLDDHGFPVGPVITANSLVFDESARNYKRTWVGWMRNDFNWRVTAAYGNATSDIDAYEDAMIPKEITFIVGEFAGQAGTTPIADNDYSTHIADYVMQQPDAE